MRINQALKDQFIQEHINEIESQVLLLQTYVESLSEEKRPLTVVYALKTLEGLVNELYRTALAPVNKAIPDGVMTFERE